MTIANELMEEGKIEDKQQVLFRQLRKKFGLSEEERVRISAVHDPDILDNALDEIITAESKEEVLRILW